MSRRLWSFNLVFLATVGTLAIAVMVGTAAIEVMVTGVEMTYAKVSGCI